MSDTEVSSAFGDVVMEPKSTEKADPAVNPVPDNKPSESSEPAGDKPSFVDKIKRSLVPESAIAAQRQKKREAKELAEKFKKENSELRAEIEKLKSDENITPEMADNSLSMLDSMDDDDVLDVATARRELAKIAKSIGQKASKQAMKAASNYFQQQEAMKQDALTKKKQQIMLEKAAKDEAEFAKKNPDVDFNMVFDVAERQGLITREEFAKVTEMPGNIVENTYERIKSNKAKADKFNALFNNNNTAVADNSGPDGKANDKENGFEADPLFDPTQ